MRLRLRGLAAALLIGFAAPPAFALEAPQSGNPVFDRAVKLVMDNFHDAAALGKFTDQVKREIDDPAGPVNAKSPEARVDEAIQAALDSLQASHIGHFRPDTIAYFELSDVFRFAIRDNLRRLYPPEGEVSYPGIGIIAAPSNGTWFVSDVYDGSTAAKAGILTGDEVLAVDGAPYHEITSFTGKIGQNVTVKVRRKAGAEPQDIKVAVERIRPLPAFERAISDSAQVFERDGRKIGYIRMWTLAARGSMGALAEQLAEGKLKDVDGLVFDLRGRWGGGSSDAAEIFLGDTPPFRLIGRDREPYLDNVRWRKPVVALIDEGTRSGLEVFAYALQVNGIKLVGSRTAGAVLGGRAYLLPDDSLLEVAVSDAVIGDDIRLEGVGVKPDIPVEYSLPYAAGADPQRDAAIEEMRRILARG